MPLLSPGGQFPSLALTPPGQAVVQLAEWCAGGFGAVPFLRGAWCQYARNLRQHAEV